MELINAPVRLAYRCAHLALRSYWFVRRPETHGALVAVWRQGRILLIRSSYRPQVSLPGGYVRRGESAQQAAARELREELGLALPPSALRHAWHGSYPFEYRQDTLDIFEVEVQEPILPMVNHRELVWADWRTPVEARALPLVRHLREYLDERAKASGS